MVFGVRSDQLFWTAFSEPTLIKLLGFEAATRSGQRICRRSRDDAFNNIKARLFGTAPQAARWRRNPTRPQDTAPLVIGLTGGVCARG